MKINGISPTGAVNQYNRQNEQRAAAKPGHKEHQKDELLISNEAKQLLGAQSLNETENSQRLQGIKQAVATNTYHVETDKLAEKLYPFLR